MLKLFLEDRGRARKLYRQAARKVLRDADIRHIEASLVYARDPAPVPIALVDLMAEAVKLAARLDLACGRPDLPDSGFLNVFPGEHYRLLNALVRVSGARQVLEIGTFTGMGTLALQQDIENVEVTTYDIVAWDRLPVPSHFKPADFETGRITQILADLSDPAVFEANRARLDAADLIFMDAPKDDRFEYRMAENFQRLAPKPQKLLVVDDIQFVNMIDFWRAITSPKLDMTSFGHWSGTGVVDISAGFRFRG